MDSAGSAGGGVTEMDAVGDRMHSQSVSNEKVNTKVGYKCFKRIFDIVSSGLGLIVLSPLFLIIAIAIMLEDGAPVFFVQERNGLNGKVFRMYKFRSMCKNAAEMHNDLLEQNELDGPAFKMKDDPRLTKVGKFLRKTSLDELPQLINVFKGEMSVVGPRPLPTYETEQLTPYQKQRLNVKQGLTCYWQCSGRSDVSFDEWMDMDMKYIEEASIRTDFRIFWKTVVKVLTGEGAY